MLPPLSFFTHFYTWTFLCCCCGAVFQSANAFNGDLSKWQVGKVVTMRGSTYTFPRLSTRSGLFSASFFSFLFFCLALILFLNNYALSSFLCGAVFYDAVAFNGDLSIWQVGNVTTMQKSTYMYMYPLSLSSFCVSTTCTCNKQRSLLFLFLTYFTCWTFLCCCVVQCLNLLLSSMVISPHGTSGK